jgi:hypothetical protein
MAFFKPLCSTHNSSKNRRFTYYDTIELLRKEQKENDSVASFQIQWHWDLHKMQIKNDEGSKMLSNSLRSLQDAYFRILMLLWNHGYVRFICTLLTPHYAFEDITFSGLDSSNFTFESYDTKIRVTPSRKSLFVRSIRIALSSIQEYGAKKEIERKLLRKDYEDNYPIIQNLLTEFENLDENQDDKLWREKLPDDVLIDISYETAIASLTGSEQIPKQEIDSKRFALLKSCMDQIGQAAQLNL